MQLFWENLKKALAPNEAEDKFTFDHAVSNGIVNPLVKGPSAVSVHEGYRYISHDLPMVKIRALKEGKRAIVPLLFRERLLFRRIPRRSFRESPSSVVGGLCVNPPGK